MNITEFYKKSNDNDSSITAPMAGSLVGGSLSHGVRHSLAKRFPKSQFLAHGLPGAVMSLGGMYGANTLARKFGKKETIKKASKKDNRIRSAIVGSLVGGRLGRAIENIMEAKGVIQKSPVKGALISAALGGLSSYGGIRAGEEFPKIKRKLERSFKKHAEGLVPIDPPRTNIKMNINAGFKGAVPQAKDAGKQLIKIKDNIPRL